MKLKLVMRDARYRNALLNALETYSQDLFIEVGEFENTDEDSLIITDYNPRKFNTQIIKEHKGGIVFLLKDDIPEKLRRRNQGPFFVFKYAGAENIMTSLNLAYSLWRGDLNLQDKNYKTICVFSDQDDKRTGYISEILSRQLIYRKGLKTIIIPLTLINNHISSCLGDRRDFLRIMYYMEMERHFSRETFFRKDNYDVEYLRLPVGINYLARLNTDKLSKMINFLGRNYFDVIVLDIGTAYTELGLHAIEKSKYGIWVHSTGREEMFNEIRRVKDGNIFKINWGYGMDRVELISEDIVMQIFDKDTGSVTDPGLGAND